MPSYCYYEEADDDIDVGPGEISAETDVAKLNEWLDQWELKHAVIAGQLAVSKAAGFPDQEWAKRATTACIYADRGLRNVRRRLRELGALTDGQKKDKANKDNAQKDEQIRALKERVESQAEHIRKVTEAASRKAAHRAAEREKERRFVEIAKDNLAGETFRQWLAEAERLANAEPVQLAAE